MAIFTRRTLTLIRTASWQARPHLHNPPRLPRRPTLLRQHRTPVGPSRASPPANSPTLPRESRASGPGIPLPAPSRRDRFRPRPALQLNSCAGCHAQPGRRAASSPPVNPQIAVATSTARRIPSRPSSQQNGPVRVVRFKTNPNGTPDGGVHNLFVITGRADATGCKIAQPDFATAVTQNNASFRIPTRCSAQD